MATVSVSTLIAVVLSFLFIIFFLMIFRSKPTKNQVEEMKETGWEIVNQIQLYLDKLAEEKEVIEKKLEEMKAIEQTVLTAEKEERKENAAQPDYADVLVANKTMNQKERIVALYQEGHPSEVISEQLRVQKGIVEVILNMEKMKKRA